MNINVDFNNKQYRPSLALVFYSANDGSNYIESHGFRLKDDHYAMQTGKPISKKAIHEIKEKIHTIESESANNISLQGFIPENLIYSNNNNANPFVVWYSKSCTRKLQFKDLGIESGEAKVPAVLYMLKGKEIFIFALRSNVKPTLETKLYHLPLFNIYTSGNVCQGSTVTRILEPSFRGIMEAWESFFWDTRFSSHLANDSKADVAALWDTLIREKKAFPTKKLKLKGTLESIMLKEI